MCANLTEWNLAPHAPYRNRTLGKLRAGFFGAFRSRTTKGVLFAAALLQFVSQLIGLAAGELLFATICGQWGVEESARRAYRLIDFCPFPAPCQSIRRWRFSHHRRGGPHFIALKFWRKTRKSAKSVCCCDKIWTRSAVGKLAPARCPAGRLIDWHNLPKLPRRADRIALLKQMASLFSVRRLITFLLHASAHSLISNMHGVYIKEQLLAAATWALFGLQNEGCE